MPSDVDALLSGPRGRRFCLEFALPRQGQDSPGGATFWRLLFYATYRLELARGQAGTLFGPGADRPLPDPSVTDIAAALDDLPLNAVDNLNSLVALAASVDSARYWQEPDGTDELLLAPGLESALERIATHIVTSPSISWWSTPMESEQWSVQFTDSDVALPVRPPADEALCLWQEQEIENEQKAIRERPVDPTANWGGEWWSKPAWSLTTSTRALGTLGPVGLSLIEDRFGWKQADSQRVDYHDAPRIFEISGTDSWAELCRAYPLDVTAARRHDWYRTTGRTGRWVIPDWSQLSRDFDAVHLSVMAYLSSAGRSIHVDADRASVIAGWNPDETYWLSDVSSEPASRASWTYNDETDRWHMNESR